MHRAREMIDIAAVVGMVVLFAILGLLLVRRIRGQPRSSVSSVIRVVVMTIVAITLVIPAMWKLSRSRSWQLFGETVRRVEREERVVALTFDDGPAVPGGTRVLDVLETAGVPATFFVIGNELEQNAEIGRRMVAEGHELGNHTYTHRRMLARSLAEVREEVERTDEAIRRLGYRGRIHFRAPNSHKLVALPLHLARTGRTSISYDIEPDSYPEVGSDAARIVDHVMERVRPGSIILLHVMYPSRAESLEAVGPLVEALRADDYRLVTVSELLAMRGGGGS